MGAGESAQLREVRRKFKPLGPAVVDVVKITEQVEKGVPEFMQWVCPRPNPHFHPFRSFTELNLNGHNTIYPHQSPKCLFS